MKKGPLTILDNSSWYAKGVVGNERHRMPLQASILSQITSGKVFIPLFGSNFEPLGYQFPANQYNERYGGSTINNATAGFIYTQKIYNLGNNSNLAQATGIRMLSPDNTYNIVLPDTNVNNILVEELVLLPFVSTFNPPDFGTNVFDFSEAACPVSIAVYKFIHGKFIKTSISTKSFFDPEYTNPKNGQPSQLIIPCNIVIDGNTVIALEYDAARVNGLVGSTAALMLDIKYRTWKTKCCE